MDVMQWCRNYLFITEGTSEKVEKKVENLLNTVLDKKDDYQKEKFIKTFCEHLSSYEGLLLYQRKIHPDQIPHNSAAFARNKDDNIRKLNEVKKQNGVTNRTTGLSLY